MLIYIEGNIGTGKSTFVRLLSTYIAQLRVNSFNAALSQEPVDEWLKTRDSDGQNILEKFYEDQTRWSFTFQMNSFISRAHKIQTERTKLEEDTQELYNSVKNTDMEFSKSLEPLLLAERSIYTDRHCFAVNCHESGKMTKMEYDIYCRWNDWLSKEFNLRPNGYIYLRCDPEVNTQRIIKRSREGECGIPIEYLQKLHEHHDLWMDKEKAQNVPVLIIDVTEDFTSTENMDAIFKSVAEFVGGISKN